MLILILIDIQYSQSADFSFLTTTQQTSVKKSLPQQNLWLPPLPTAICKTQYISRKIHTLLGENMA